MAIDFTFPPDVEKIRLRVRDFVEQAVRPAEKGLDLENGDQEARRRLIMTIVGLREKAREWGLWLPQMPAEYRPFATEVSMCKHHVANTLWQTVDRAVQVHGALGYSTDTPLAQMLLQARWSRFADGADEVHKMRIATSVIETYQETGSTMAAFGDLPV